LNVAFIKLDKPSSGIKNEILRMIRKIFNVIKNEDNIFYLPFNYIIDNNIVDSENNIKFIKTRMKSSLEDIENINLNYNILINKKVISKIKKVLEEKSYDLICCENGIEINYKKFDGSNIIKYMLPELIRYLEKQGNKKYSQIFICANDYNENVKEIIIELSQIVKIVNIVSNNKRYKILEEELSKKGTEITVLNSKRKTLKNAEILINIDFNNFNEYNLNRELIFIDLLGDSKLPKGYYGKYIKKIKVKTSKILRIYSEFENFEKSELIENEISQIKDYNLARNYVIKNKLEIE
jgi:hypothetical protein